MLRPGANCCATSSNPLHSSHRNKATNPSSNRKLGMNASGYRLGCPQSHTKRWIGTRAVHRTVEVLPLPVSAETYQATTGVRRRYTHLAAAQRRRLFGVGDAAMCDTPVTPAHADS